MVIDQPNLEPHRLPLVLLSCSLTFERQTQEWEMRVLDDDDYDEVGHMPSSAKKPEYSILSFFQRAAKAAGEKINITQDGRGAYACVVVGCLTLTPRCFAVAKKRGRKPKEKGAPTVPRALAVLQSATLNNETCHVEPGSKRVRLDVGKHHCLLWPLTVSLQIVFRRALQSGPMWWLVVHYVNKLFAKKNYNEKHYDKKNYNEKHYEEKPTEMPMFYEVSVVIEEHKGSIFALLLLLPEMQQQPRGAPSSRTCWPRDWRRSTTMKTSASWWSPPSRT